MSMLTSTFARALKRAGLSRLSFLSGCLVTGMVLILATTEVFASHVISQPSRQRTRTVSAKQFPGEDLGEKINAADSALGTAAGEILVEGGGTISTQVIISSDHILRFKAGTYTTTTAKAPILLQPRSSVIGSGWDTIIMESTTPRQFNVIIAYHHALENGTADSGLTVRDLQIKGANPGFYSSPAAVELGNCTDCVVDHVWINGTRSIGVQVGGSSRKGHFALNTKVINCLFTRVASQNLALVNGKNILFEGNRFITSGQIGGPGNTNIDLEPNEIKDRLENVIVRNNLIDVRKSDRSPTGNGIVVQSTSGTTLVGPILVEKNTLIGGETEGTITNVLSNGIYIIGHTMRDVTVRDNTIRRTGLSGIRIEGGTRLTVINNQLFDVGGGGNAGFFVQATNSRIVGNSYSYSGRGPADGRMVIHESSRGNTYENNRGWTLVGNIR